MAYQPPPPPQPEYGSYGAPMQYAQPVYANWLYRVASYIIDSIVVGAVVWVALIIANVIGPVDASGSANPVAILLYLVGAAGALIIGIWNLFIRQGRTGQSLGKQAVGTRLISESTGQPIGALMAFVRQIAHILDGLACYIGYLWPIWDSKSQTFADKIVGTVVVKT